MYIQTRNLLLYIWIKVDMSVCKQGMTMLEHNIGRCLGDALHGVWMVMTFH
jgi:hypothetical protein